MGALWRPVGTGQGHSPTVCGARGTPRWGVIAQVSSARSESLDVVQRFLLSFLASLV